MLSRVSEFFDLWNMRLHIGKCIKVVDSTANLVPQSFINVLIAAEDRRSSMHYGVDPVAMIRALYKWILFREIQGASTIEQQFVRVVSGRYERSFTRKLREQMLAIAVSRRRDKHKIAGAYLSVAYYGYGRVGLSALTHYCGFDLSRSNMIDALGIISRLKYPEPRKPSIKWSVKFERRVRYIANQYNKAFPSCVKVSIPNSDPMEMSFIGVPPIWSAILLRTFRLPRTR